jgi:hypothetical protein
VLTTEILQSIPSLLIGYHPNIVLSIYKTGLTYHRETYTKLSARTVGHLAGVRLVGSLGAVDRAGQ